MNQYFHIPPIQLEKRTFTTTTLILNTTPEKAKEENWFKFSNEVFSWVKDILFIID